MIDKDFDNNDNPYLLFKLHRYTNMPQDLQTHQLDEGKTSLDLEIPLKMCGNINEDNLWWEKAKIYCPSYRPTDILNGDFNYP